MPFCPERRLELVEMFLDEPPRGSQVFQVAVPVGVDFHGRTAELSPTAATRREFVVHKRLPEQDAIKRSVEFTTEIDEILDIFVERPSEQDAIKHSVEFTTEIDEIVQEIVAQNQIGHRRSPSPRNANVPVRDG
jgi:hypothetical protein